MIGESYYDQFVSVCLSVCLCTVLPLQLKNYSINQAQIWWADFSWGTDRFFQISMTDRNKLITITLYRRALKINIMTGFLPHEFLFNLNSLWL